MKTSTERILTTHSGSLPRPKPLIELILRREAGAAVDEQVFEAETAAAVDEAIAAQVAAGIDVASDGEMSKPSYTTYIRHRVSGIEPDPRAAEKGRDIMQGRDLLAHPDFTSQQRNFSSTPFPGCVGELRYRDRSGLDRDIAHLKAAAAKSRPAEVFMTAPSPGILTRFIINLHYPTEDAYVAALADVMRHEYRAIIEAGFLLQTRRRRHEVGALLLLGLDAAPGGGLRKRTLARAPKMVAELGPGDFLGVGLAALVSGVESYHAFDVVQARAGRAEPGRAGGDRRALRRARRHPRRGGVPRGASQPGELRVPAPHPDRRRAGGGAAEPRLARIREARWRARTRQGRWSTTARAGSTTRPSSATRPIWSSRRRCWSTSTICPAPTGRWRSGSNRTACSRTRSIFAATTRRVSGTATGRYSDGPGG